MILLLVPMHKTGECNAQQHVRRWIQPALLSVSASSPFSTAAALACRSPPLARNRLSDLTRCMSHNITCVAVGMEQHQLHHKVADTTEKSQVEPEKGNAWQMRWVSCACGSVWLVCHGYCRGILMANPIHTLALICTSTGVRPPPRE